MKNTIDPVGLVTERGAHVVLTGPVECTEGERLHTRVTVSQRSTGAVAEGRALAHTTDRGKANDAHQWLCASRWWRSS